MTTAPRPGPRQEAGFTLIEIAISLVIFSIVLLSLGRTTLQLAQVSNRSSGVVQRNAETVKQVNRLEALTWDSLSPRAGCVTPSSAALPHQRCVTLTALSTTRTQVQVVIAPTAANIRPDTAIFERSNVASINPFAVP